MKQLKKTILTLVALFAMTTGAWAQTGENIFQYCYDCQRNPAYPTTMGSASLSGFQNPYVGYKGIGSGMGNTSDGPWKLEYMGIWSATDNHGIDDVSTYQNTYGCTDVPVFRLYQWNATANEYQHAAYGVVCCYAKVSNAVEHTALFVAQGGWGCVLTNSSHSSSMNITFDEDLTTGLTTLIAAATPNASSATAVEVTWDATSKTGTFDMPGGNVELEPEYYPQAELAMSTGTTPVALAPAAIDGVPANTDAPIVTAGTVANIGTSEVPQGTLMYFVSQSTGNTAPEAPDYDDEGWSEDVPTANGLAQGNAYVWYYIKGAEPAQVTDRTDANTRSDSDIMPLGTTGFVTLAPEPTYNVTLNAEGLSTDEAAAWKAGKGTDQPAAFPLEGVTKGETVTVTYTGTRKVIGVKAEKKAANPNAYLKWDATKKELVEAEIPATATTVANANQEVNWEAGTYVVEGEVEINGNIILDGNVDLIIKDGAKLTANKIYGNSSNYNLSIYGQANQTGELVVNCTNDDAIYTINTLEVHSCQVTATSSESGCGGFYHIRTFNVYGGSVDSENTGTYGYGFWLATNSSMNIYGGDVKAVGKGTDNSSYGFMANSPTSVTVYGGKLWAECAGNEALNSNITLTKGAGFTGKIETSSDGTSWTEYTSAGTPETKYVRVGY